MLHVLLKSTLHATQLLNLIPDSLYSDGTVKVLAVSAQIASLSIMEVEVIPDVVVLVGAILLNESAVPVGSSLLVRLTELVMIFVLTSWWNTLPLADV